MVALRHPVSSCGPTSCFISNQCTSRLYSPPSCPTITSSASLTKVCRRSGEASWRSLTLLLIIPIRWSLRNYRGSRITNYLNVDVRDRIRFLVFVFVVDQLLLLCIFRPTRLFFQWRPDQCHEPWCLVSRVGLLHTHWRGTACS